MIIIYIAVAVLILFVLVAAMQPADFSVSRSISMGAPPETPFALANDMRAFQTWSPWAKLDPNAKITYEGPPAGVGAAFTWSGNMQVGAGRLTVTESLGNEIVRFSLEMIKPMKGTNSAEFTFKADGERTIVKWTMFGTRNFAAKAMGLFMNCEKMVGGQFEKGLASMKSLAEASAKPLPVSSRA